MKSDNENRTVINMLDQAIDYGKDLKIRIQSDSENNLDTLKSEFKSWVSDNKNRLEQVIPNYNSYERPLIYSESYSQSELLGDLEDKIAEEYMRAVKNLISGVEHELNRLSSIREEVLNGTIVPNIDSKF